MCVNVISFRWIYVASFSGVNITSFLWVYKELPNGFIRPLVKCVPKKVLFLFLDQNICCGYSKEPSQWDCSFEHQKHMIKLMGKKIFTILRTKNCLSKPVFLWPHIASIPMKTIPLLYEGIFSIAFLSIPKKTIPLLYVRIFSIALCSMGF